MQLPKGAATVGGVAHGAATLPAPPDLHSHGRVDATPSLPWESGEDDSTKDACPPWKSRPDGEDLMLRLRRAHPPSFDGWSDEAWFRRAFNRLLADMQSVP